MFIHHRTHIHTDAYTFHSIAERRERVLLYIYLWICGCILLIIITAISMVVMDVHMSACKMSDSNLHHTCNLPPVLIWSCFVSPSIFLAFFFLSLSSSFHICLICYCAVWLLLLFLLSPSVVVVFIMCFYVGFFSHLCIHSCLRAARRPWVI